MLDLCLVGSSEGNRASAPDSRPLAARLWIRSIALDRGDLAIGSPRFEDEATKSWEARKVRSKRRFFRDTSRPSHPSSGERGNDVYPRSIWEVKTGLGGLEDLGVGQERVTGEAERGLVPASRVGSRGMLGEGEVVRKERT